MNDGIVGEVWMTQLVPKVKKAEIDRSHLAEALGLSIAEIDAERPLELYDNGLAVLIVPVVSLEASRKIWPNSRALGEIARSAGALTVLVFTQETVSPDSHVHARVFAPEAGVSEDPATGSANGPLGVYLVRHGMVPARPVTRLRSEQGIEMKRPSILEIEVHSDGDSIQQVRVGGHARIVGQGHMFIHRELRKAGLPTAAG